LPCLHELEADGASVPAAPRRVGRKPVSAPSRFPPRSPRRLGGTSNGSLSRGERGFVFIGPKGGQLRRPNFHKSVWNKARQAVGLPNLHFHDLRHTGGTLSAATGATLKELMARLGHSSMRAAMIYQHATRDRDQAIAKALGTFVRGVQNAAEKQADERENAKKEA
jgi:integrase